jgi:cyclase
MRVLSLAAAALLAVSAFAQDYSKVQIKVIPVAGSVYMLTGAGGNIGVSVGDDGVVIIDDQFAPLAPKIQDAIKGITAKPIRFVINTHYHGDHTGGNAEFSKQSTIIAQENVRKRLETGTNTLGRSNPPAPKDALPVITFNDRATVHLNGEDIRAIHFPHGHTDGDAIIFFTKSNVVHMGDDFVTYGFPFIDIDNGGSVQGLIEDLDKVIPQIPAGAKIIPGHGPLSTVADVKDFLQMVKDTQAAVKASLAQGKTLNQMKQEKVLAKWQKYSGDFINSDQWIETIYDDITKTPPPANQDKHHH